MWTIMALFHLKTGRLKQTEKETYYSCSNIHEPNNGRFHKHLGEIKTRRHPTQFNKEGVKKPANTIPEKKQGHK